MSKKKKEKTYTHEEFLKKFFPKKTTPEFDFSGDPKELGISLARDTLKKVDRALSQK